jgi:hypothetical protein
VASRVPASERTSQKLDELLTQGVAEGDARAELIKLAVRKIVEEALEAEVAEAVGRDYYENGAAPGPATATGIGAAACARPKGPSSTACRKWRIGPSRSSRGCELGWPAGRRSWSVSRSRCSPGG